MARLEIEEFDRHNPETPGSDVADLRLILVILRRRMWSMLFVAVLIFSAVTLYTLQQTPLYTASARLLIDSRESRVVDFEAVLSGLPPNSAAIDTEVEVLRSRSLAQAVVSRTGLTTIPEFNTALQDENWRDRLLRQLAALGGAVLANRTHTPNGEETPEMVMDRVAEELLEHSSARRLGSTFVIEVSATSQSPELAQEMANAYAEEYLLAQLEAKFSATERANGWLFERVAALREEVQAAEQAVARYRDEHGLLDAEGATLTEQQISDTNAQLIVQRAELTEARARLRNVRSRLDQGVGPESIAEVLNSEVVRELRSQEAMVSRQRGELMSRYGARHPEIQTVERELADIRVQIDQEINRIVSNLESEVNIAAERANSLAASLQDLRSELGTNNAALVNLRALEREANASRAMFESFLNRFRQTDEADQFNEADARIVANATLPLEASSPRLVLNFALGLALAGLGAILAALLREILESGLRTEAEVERKLGVPHIASVPKLKPGFVEGLRGRRPDPGQYVLNKPLSSIAESYRTLRSGLKVAGLDKPLTVVAVTSALPGEGKTTTTIALGRIAAQAADRVLAIDCDLRRRGLSMGLAPDAATGMLEVLASESSLEDAIVVDEQSGLHVLPLTVRSFSPKDLFRSEAFKALLERVRGQYDLILLDTAPVMAVADTRAIAGLVDGMIFSVEWGRSPVGAARLSIDALTRAKGNIVGVVLNGVDINRQARYGYGAYYTYYGSYQKYYTN
ncbi:polysaccharide biosynthesis tyrosine autokinase [Maricaulis sp.]|uniref:polysaccharide biosynthesis tyrosine autokinase n=1 Tax=Maricaulis sp. TaxID=1486257 RepID=UPI003A93A3CB